MPGVSVFSHKQCRIAQDRFGLPGWFVVSWGPQGWLRPRLHPSVQDRYQDYNYGNHHPILQMRMDPKGRKFSHEPLVQMPPSGCQMPVAINKSFSVSAGSRMPEIMIRCPILGTAIPTGLTTEQIKFVSLAGIEIPLRCPACLKIHRWEQKDAWVAQEE